jgi:hypothetical protein
MSENAFADVVMGAFLADGLQKVSDAIETFVRACLDEDERMVLDHWDSDGRARIATMWTGSEPGYTTVASDQGDGVWVADGREVTDARHVQVLFDPARVLAEVAAQRKLLDLIHEWARNCPAPAGNEAAIAHWMRLALAQPYAGRPGWREEWATGGAA